MPDRPIPIRSLEPGAEQDPSGLLITCSTDAEAIRRPLKNSLLECARDSAPAYHSLK